MNVTTQLKCDLSSISLTFLGILVALLCRSYRVIRSTKICPTVLKEENKFKSSLVLSNIKKYILIPTGI